MEEEDLLNPQAPEAQAPAPEPEQLQAQAGGDAGNDAPAAQIPGWQKRVKEHYADREFANDDELNAAAEEMIDELSNYQKAGKEANAKLIEVFEAEPEVAAFMADVMKGASIPVALARNFDLENITPAEGEPDYGEWEAAAQERRKAAEGRAKLQEELTSNKVESSKAFEAFEKEKGLSESEADDFLDKIEAYLGDIYKGRVTKEFLDAMYKATDYESALSKARTEAELKARNSKVEAEKKNYAKPKGDGLPQVQSTGGQIDKPAKKKPRFLQALDEIEEREKSRV